MSAGDGYSTGGSVLIKGGDTTSTNTLSTAGDVSILTGTLTHTHTYTYMHIFMYLYILVHQKNSDEK